VEFLRHGEEELNSFLLEGKRRRETLMRKTKNTLYKSKNQRYKSPTTDLYTSCIAMFMKAKKKCIYHSQNYLFSQWILYLLQKCLFQTKA